MVGNRGEYMKINRKIVIFLLVGLILVCSGNIIYYKKHILKSPLFIKNYSILSKGLDLKIHYIQNINSNDKIVSIELPELKNKMLNFSEDDKSSDKAHYKLKEITIKFLDDEIYKYSNRTITKAKIKFSNGKTMKVDLGEIYIDDTMAINGYLNNISTSVSSVFPQNGEISGNSTLQACKSVKILGIGNRFSKVTDGILKLKLNEKNISQINFPMNVNCGDTIYLEYGLSCRADDKRINNDYDVPLNILTEDSDGNKRVQDIFITRSINSVDDINVNLLKKNSIGSE